MSYCKAYPQNSMSSSHVNDFNISTDLILVNLNRYHHTSQPILLLERMNKTSGFKYFPKLRYRDNSRVDCPCPETPAFVKNMDPKLFSQIQGTVPFGQSEDSYLILFKIRDRLQYCLTEESEVWHNFDSEFN